MQVSGAEPELLSTRVRKRASLALACEAAARISFGLHAYYSSVKKLLAAPRVQRRIVRRYFVEPHLQQATDLPRERCRASSNNLTRSATTLSVDIGVDEQEAPAGPLERVPDQAAAHLIVAELTCGGPLRHPAPALGTPLPARYLSRSLWCAARAQRTADQWSACMRGLLRSPVVRARARRSPSGLMALDTTMGLPSWWNRSPDGGAFIARIGLLPVVLYGLAADDT
jgi:hypothetical protein